MTETTHTPAPWQATDSSPLYVTAGPSILATMHFSLRPTAEVKANAHLMAAAPELLDNLKNVLSRFQDLLGPEGHRNGEIAGDVDAIKQAHAVIAKATGE